MDPCTCTYNLGSIHFSENEHFFNFLLPQALDRSSPLFMLYSEHLSMATAFYTQLLAQMEAHYQLQVTSMDYTQLQGTACLCVCFLEYLILCECLEILL